MIYNNDDTDKGIRKRNYLLTVIASPAAVIIIILAITYFLYTNNYIKKIDRNYCYFLSVSIATLLFTFNKRKWLKMPDGSYFRVQDTERKNINSYNEPAQFERIYYNSKSNKAVGILAGAVIIVFAVYFYLKHISYVLPVIMIVAGLFAIGDGIKGLLDKSPKLQLSAKGLWTQKLGFVKWKDINKAQVITEGDSEHSRIILEIYLKNTVFAKANYPDERLMLTDIDDNKFIETDIDHFSKKQSEKSEDY